MTDESFQALAQAVRLRVVAKYGAQIGLMLAALTTVPFAMALLLGDPVVAGRFAVVIGLLLALGLFSRLPAPDRIQTNEALATTALVFIFGPVLMSYPLMAAGLGFADALFEAVSALTTTGLTTVTGLQERPPAFLFARAWMQWYGGLGIVILSVALLMGHSAAARRLAEPSYTGETVVATIRTHTRRVVVIYLVLTVVAVAALWPMTGHGFTAVAHALTAVSTGGFATHDASLAALPAAAAPLALALAFLGAVSLPLYHRVWRHGWRAAAIDPELRGLLAAAAVVALLTAASAARAGLGWPEALWHGALIGVSAQTGTGFTTLHPPQLGATAQLVLIVAMLVGGSIGSTTGGIKVLRLLMLAKLLRAVLQRTAVPDHAVVTPRLGGRALEPDDLIRALSLIALFAVVVLVSWLVFLVHGYAPLPALFEVASAVGTVGLTAGLTRPELEPALKAVLCFDMIAGRLEIVALLVVLYPKTWLGRRDRTQ